MPDTPSPGTTLHDAYLEAWDLAGAGYPLAATRIKDQIVARLDGKLLRDNWNMPFEWPTVDGEPVL